MLLITPQSTPSFARARAGGKAHNLYLLSRAGLPVPAWLALPPECFEAFVAQNGLAEDLARLQGREAEELLAHAPWPSELRDFALKARGRISAPLVSVRSSALGEDSGTHSFAGQLSSFLYVEDEEDYLMAIKRCWASAYSDRAQAYKAQNGLPRELRVAVIVQEMIDAQKSGVLFTCDPVRGTSHSMVVNAVYGVGEGLVSGALDADTYVLERSEGRVVSSELALKTARFARSGQGSGIQELPVPEEGQQGPCLSHLELAELWKIGEKVEALYHRPQDIEWAIAGGKLYLLQARPVTSAVQGRHGELFIWDNSNIVESYGGHTLPLTFGFAHYVYHQVYVQFCEVLLVPRSVIREMDFFLKDMLGLFDGRVYYNLLNWYKLTSILPGYKYNRSFMETMMGTDKSLEEEIAQRIRPPAYHRTWMAQARRAVTGAKFLWFHFTIQSLVDRFLAHFYSVYKVFRQKDYSRLPAHAIYRDYQELERRLLWKWHAPIINDFLCMVHYGLFKKLTERWLGHFGSSFHNDLLAGNGNLESALPTKRLIQLAALVQQTPGLGDYLARFSPHECLEALAQSPYQEFYQQVQDYIASFGFRCMSEMKLEQKDMHHDPSLFFVFLSNLLVSGQTDLEVYERREREIRQKAESLLDQGLRGPRRWIYAWSLKNARQAVRNRENTRFCRTRIYGVVRAMMNGIGADFASRGILKCPEDVFYLSLEELKGSLEGTNSVQDLDSLVQLRRKQYASYAQSPAPASRFMTRGPVYWNNPRLPQQEEDEAQQQAGAGPALLRGLPCSPGVVEGPVKIILGPQDDLRLNGEILVTERTDPGWIPLYPSARGLLVERGGLLSHSAIVAREMGLPTIVGIKGLTAKLKTGMRVRLDGQKGTVEILEGD